MGGLRIWQCRSRYRRGAAAVALFLLAWLGGTCLLHRWLSIDPDDVPPAVFLQTSPQYAGPEMHEAAVGDPPGAVTAGVPSPIMTEETEESPPVAKEAAPRELLPHMSTGTPEAVGRRSGEPGSDERARSSAPARLTAAKDEPQSFDETGHPFRQKPNADRSDDKETAVLAAELIPAPNEVAGPSAATSQSVERVAAHSVPGGGAPVSSAPPPPNPNAIIQTGCSACGAGGGVLRPGGEDYPAGFGGCGCCAASVCVGRKPCYPCDGSTTLARFLCGVYQCVCCPDPCYEGRWRAVGNAAFFVDPIRPQTQQRVRWDAGFDLIFPDRAEFFWPKQNGPGPLVPLPLLGEKRLTYHDLSLYTEVSAGLISFFVELPYRSLKPELLDHAAGFSDMNLGTKSLLYDCELFQLAFQFRTYLPTGNFSKGLGAFHVSLEPSVLLGVNVAPETYLQAQVAEWIPLGGDPGYAGALLHYHVSLNQVLWRVVPDVPLIGTMEASGWSFQNGSYTDPVLGPYQKASGETYVSLGPGLRLVICDKVDFGVGTAFAVTRGHWADELFRSEFRWRF